MSAPLIGIGVKLGCYGIVLLVPVGSIGVCLLLAGSSHRLTVNMQAHVYFGEYAAGWRSASS